MGEPAQTGADVVFATTHWSLIEAARTSTPEHRRTILDDLARRYWKPVYHYLRARGYQEADAVDITQDFFVEVVLGRDLFGRANEHRGRFRPFLLHCLKNFLRERGRYERAKRRAPEGTVFSIGQWAEAERARNLPPTPTDGPEDVFHHKWAASLLELVLDRLYASCARAGMDVHYEVFRQRVVLPTLEHRPAVPLGELAKRFGLSVKQITNRAETIRRRFRRLLMDEVRLTVLDRASAEDELRSLMGRLARRVG